MATFAERACQWYGEEQHERLRALYSILSYSAPADERHVLSLPQSNLAAPKIARGRYAHVTPSHLGLSRMLLENDRLALL